MKNVCDLIFIRDNGDARYSLDYVSAKTKKMTGFERVDMSPIHSPEEPLNSLYTVTRGRMTVPSLWINLVQCTDEAFPFIHRSEKGIYK